MWLVTAVHALAERVAAGKYRLAKVSFTMATPAAPGI